MLDTNYFNKRVFFHLVVDMKSIPNYMLLHALLDMLVFTP